MTVIALKTGAGKDTIEASKHANDEAATAAGFSAVHDWVELVAYLKKCAFTLSAAVRLFNEHSPAKVTRFSDFNDAGKRLFKALMANIPNPTTKETDVDTPTTTATKAKKAIPAIKAAHEAKKAKTAAKKVTVKKASTGQRGRTSKFTGKLLVIGKGIKLDADKKPVNPRRAGTAGFTQLQWIIDATPKGGISYEDWIKKGGLPINLRHDEIETWVALKDAKAK